MWVVALERPLPYIKSNSITSGRGSYHPALDCEILRQWHLGLSNLSRWAKASAAGQPDQRDLAAGWVFLGEGSDLCLLAYWNFTFRSSLVSL